MRSCVSPESATDQALKAELADAASFVHWLNLDGRAREHKPLRGQAGTHDF